MAGQQQQGDCPPQPTSASVWGLGLRRSLGAGPAAPAARGGSGRGTRGFCSTAGTCWLSGPRHRPGPVEPPSEPLPGRTPARFQAEACGEGPRVGPFGWADLRPGRKCLAPGFQGSGVCLLEGPGPGARELGRARLSPTKPGMAQAPQPGADVVPERPAARRRGGRAPAPSQGGLHFLAEVKALSTPEKKISFLNYHSPKWAAGPQAFPHLGAIHLPYSQESATCTGVQAAAAVLGRPRAPRTGCPVVCAPNPTSLPRP